MQVSIIALALSLGATGPYEVELRGQVRTVKDGPATRAALIVGDDTHLLGARRPPMDEELKNLEGTTVVVRGTRDPYRSADVLVEEYEIVDVGDGKVPRIGQLAQLETPDGPRLLFVDQRGRADYLPESWSKRMTKHVGAKVWILGRRDGDRYVPVRFRILRTPAAS